MVEEEKPKPIVLGIFESRGERRPISSIEVIAAVLSALWLLGTTLFFVLTSGEPEGGKPSIDSTRMVMTLIAIFLPVALIWVAAAASRSSRVMKEESEHLYPATAIGCRRHAVRGGTQVG